MKEILNGNKIYEFRKQLININGIQQVYIYETAPVKKITAICNISQVLQGTPQEIWNKCNMYGTICQEDFFKYFQNRKIAYAYKLENVRKVCIELVQIVPNNIPPQSYFYINKE